MRSQTQKAQAGFVLLVSRAGDSRWRTVGRCHGACALDEYTRPPVERRRHHAHSHSETASWFRTSR